MPRNRFVRPEVDRLYLVDVHRREHQRLTEQLAAFTGKPAERAPLEEALAREAAAITQAQDDGDFIDVKKRLNAGERRRVFTRQIKIMHLGERAELDPAQVGLGKALEYIIGWSFVDGDGKPVLFSASALDNIDGESYAEILAAIEHHDDQADQAAVDAKKPIPTGEAASSVTSASVGG